MAGSCKANNHVPDSTELLKPTGVSELSPLRLSPGIPRRKNLSGQWTQTRLGNSSLREWHKSLRGQSCLNQPAQQTTEGVEGPKGHHSLSPFPAQGIRARPHSGTLTFFRGCHFIIFVQPIRGTSRCWLGAGGRCRAAATASHAASLPPPNSFPYSLRREKAQESPVFSPSVQ